MHNFKPLLGVEAQLDQLQYPLIGSKKLDGIRAIIKDGKLLSRSLKELPNRQIQDKLKDLIEFCQQNNLVLDGELYNHNLTFQEITSQVMSYDVAFDLKFHIFDIIVEGKPEIAFEIRNKQLNEIFSINNFPEIEIVEQLVINNEVELLNLFNDNLSAGYEGLMLRKASSKYKFGRSTLRESYLLKVKPYLSFDAKIIDIKPRFINLNESKINELGYKSKSRTVDNRLQTDIAATFTVEYENKLLDVVITGTEQERRNIWQNKENYLGKYIEYKAMLVGAKDLPRHPVFLRFRPDKD